MNQKQITRITIRDTRYAVEFVCRYRDENEYAIRRCTDAARASIVVLDNKATRSYFGDAIGLSEAEARQCVDAYEAEAQAAYLKWREANPHLCA